jgi:hypothetical protein
MKYLSHPLLLLIAICLASAKIEIKAIPEDQLKNFMLYKSTMLVSPFKSEENLRSPPIMNYMPIKIKLVNNPNISIKESGASRRRRLLKRARKLQQNRKALL